VHGIRIGNIVTHILRIPEETSLRHEANGMPEMGLASNYDVAGALGEDTGHESENLTNPSQSPVQSPWERPMLMVSADRHRVVRKIQRNRLV